MPPRHTTVPNFILELFIRSHLARHRVVAFLGFGTIDSESAPHSADRNEIAHPPRCRQPSRQRRRLARKLCAVIAAIPAVAVTYVVEHTGSNDHMTAIGDHKAVDLSEGSTMTLDTDSDVSVRETPGLLSLRVVTGQALFRLRPTPQRSILVTAGDARIAVNDADMCVSVQAGGTTITVLEGSVQLSALDAAIRSELKRGYRTDSVIAEPLPLRAGDRVRVTRSGADVTFGFEGSTRFRIDTRLSCSPT